MADNYFPPQVLLVCGERSNCFSMAPSSADEHGRAEHAVQIATPGCLLFHQHAAAAQLPRISALKLLLMCNPSNPQHGVERKGFLPAPRRGRLLRRETQEKFIVLMCVSLSLRVCVCVCCFLRCSLVTTSSPLPVC